MAGRQLQLKSVCTVLEVVSDRHKRYGSQVKAINSELSPSEGRAHIVQIDGSWHLPSFLTRLAHDALF